MTKGVKDKSEFDGQEENEDEFSQSSDPVSPLSSKSLTSDDEYEHFLSKKQKEPPLQQDSKKILEELEKSKSSDSDQSQDSAVCMR